MGKIFCKPSCIEITCNQVMARKFGQTGKRNEMKLNTIWNIITPEDFFGFKRRFYFGSGDNNIHEVFTFCQCTNGIGGMLLHTPQNKRMDSVGNKKNSQLACKLYKSS